MLGRPDGALAILELGISPIPPDGWRAGTARARGALALLQQCSEVSVLGSPTGSGGQGRWRRLAGLIAAQSPSRWVLVCDPRCAWHSQTALDPLWSAAATWGGACAGQLPRSTLACSDVGGRITATLTRAELRRMRPPVLGRASAWTAVLHSLAPRQEDDASLLQAWPELRVADLPDLSWLEDCADLTALSTHP